jgi:iron-sulfur cluster repair protein YtfE (RIC family)
MTHNEQLDHIEEIANKLRRILGALKQQLASLEKRLDELSKFK